MEQQELYNQLAYYTLSLQDEEFIHQLVVDAFAAQHFSEKTKPIGITFALVGLYLVFEKNYTGRQAQLAHIALAKANMTKVWPTFAKPNKEAEITISDVLNVADGEKNEMIRKWANSVWEIYKPQEDKVKNLLSKYLDIN